MNWKNIRKETMRLYKKVASHAIIGFNVVHGCFAPPPLNHHQVVHYTTINKQSFLLKNSEKQHFRLFFHRNRHNYAANFQNM